MQSIQKNVKKNLHKYILGCLLCFSVFSFTIDDGVQNFVEKVVNRFGWVWVKMPQEKLYLHTDKPYYCTGEDIWVKAYLLNATTHLPTTLSKFVYIELINQGDSILERVKIRKDSLGFNGHIKLKADLATGYYNLRAYTHWMQNNSSDFFFNKPLYISNITSGNVNSEISYGTLDNGELPVNVTFTDDNHIPLSGKTILIEESWNNSRRKKTALTNSSGKINLSIPISKSDKEEKHLSVSIADDNTNYENTFYLPGFGSDFDVQFFPESGSLLTNNMQVVAFKAIGSNGLSVEVKGNVFNENGQEITELETMYKGMGKFSLLAIPGESYYAIVESVDGLKKRFELPSAQNRGVSMHLVHNGNNILYQIINQTSINNNSLYLLVHCRGDAFVVQPLKSLTGKISKTLIPEGINTCSVIDTLGNTYCERLFFRTPTNLPIVKMESDKRSYNRRDLVNLNFTVNSVSGKACLGNYSLSITDGYSVKMDTLNDNILSYLLLSSDIKGHIEDPALYFADQSMSSLQKLDILMLTQGWRRFNTSEIIKGQIKQPKYYLEAGQSVSGQVLNIFNKPVKNCDVVMISGYKNTFRTTHTDTLGRFLLEGIEFPDSTTLILKAQKKRTIVDVEIIPDKDVFPTAKSWFPPHKIEKIAAPNEYLEQSREKYYYEGGMRMINLDEVTVKAEKKETNVSDSFYAGMADSELTSEQLQRFSSMSVLDQIGTMAGVLVSGTSISIRGANGNPLILVDDFETEDVEELKYLTSDMVENIALFKGPSAAIFGSRGGNGVIAITLKTGAERKQNVVTQASVSAFQPLGFAEPAEFYVPKYEVDSIRNSKIPDLRTTIYWNPNLTTDSTGVTKVKFYTADNSNDYTVILEGLTNEGEICRFVGTLKRENE